MSSFRPVGLGALLPDESRPLPVPQTKHAARPARERVRPLERKVPMALLNVESSSSPCLPPQLHPGPSRLHSSSKCLTSPFLHLVTWPRVSAMQVAGGVGFVVRSVFCSSCCSFSLCLPGSSELHVCPPLVPCEVSTPGCCGPIQIPFLWISSMFILPCSACVSRTCHPP